MEGSAVSVVDDAERKSPQRGGFREALPLLHKGEEAIVWMPPGEGVAETLVYEIELLDIISPPAAASRAPAAAGEATLPAAATRTASDPPPPAAASRASMSRR